MKVFENLSIFIFGVICFGFTCYQTYKQFREYIRNEDTASIEYRNFNQEEKDEYLNKWNELSTLDIDLSLFR